MNIEDYFNIQIFFIILRETLESAIIVSVLLSFLKQNFTLHDPTEPDGIKYSIPKREYRKLQTQVWLGSLIGLSICFVIGGGFVLVFYLLGNDLWSLTERLWEGVFSIFSSLIISVMGLSLLKVNNLTKKWKFKLSSLLQNRGHKAHSNSLMTKISKFNDKYSLALLPFVTTLREGLEAVVFIGGIGAAAPLTSLPLSIIFGAGLGAGIGITLYKSGNKMSLNYFLIFSTCFLYLIASGLMSRGVWFLELEQFVRKCGFLDPSETGSGPGSYDISVSIWHVNCCNGLTDSYWMLLNAIFGWTNSATYGSVISYNLYWIFLIIVLRLKIAEEKQGYMPFVPIRWQLKKIQKKIRIYQAVHESRILLTSSHVVDEDLILEQELNEESSRLLGASPTIGLNQGKVIDTLELEMQ